MDALDTPFCLKANNSSEFEVQDILDSCTVNLSG